MAPLVLFLPALRVLCVLLLLAAPLRAQNEWDNAICTKNVSVTRGHSAILYCNISHPLEVVSIYREASAKDQQCLFENVSQGHFSKTGRELWVEGGMARLVIKEVQDIHTGWYSWHLVGKQKSTSNITLNMLEPPTPSTSLQVDKSIETTPPSSPAPETQIHEGSIILVCTVVLVAVLALAGLVWRKTRGPSKVERLLQALLSSVPTLREDQDSEQDRLESGIQS